MCTLDKVIKLATLKCQVEELGEEVIKVYFHEFVLSQKPEMNNDKSDKAACVSDLAQTFNVQFLLCLCK